MWTNAWPVLTAAVKMLSAQTPTVATHAHAMLATLAMEKIAQKVSDNILYNIIDANSCHFFWSPVKLHYNITFWI